MFALERTRHRSVSVIGLIGLLSLLVWGFALSNELPSPPSEGHATSSTRLHNAQLREALAGLKSPDLAEASRGLVARATEPLILNPDGSVAWDLSAYAFLDEEAPDTANPSLWRQSQLNALHGLYEVVDGIWQIRGYDLAVMTVIRGEQGWIVIDPLTTPATAAAGLALVNQHLGDRVVSAVIYTHSHADHFAGVRGVITNEDLASRQIPVIAPQGFAEEAVKENLLAGNAMIRRSQFQFGTQLPVGPSQHIGTGLGQRLSVGEVGLLLPSREISSAGEEVIIDGIQFEFMDAADTEAPAELVFFLPQFNALCGAEVMSRTFHNLLTPRGAKARDALRWSQVIDNTLLRYGQRTEVLFNSHHWPTWGQQAVTDMLRNQRDRYRHVHDQTLRLANHGMTLHEIAEALQEPKFVNEDFAVRGYYGTLNHNAKAVYQYYFGWWDGVPANYHPHPPETAAVRYVNAMGGRDQAMSQGTQAFESGDYRWAATLFNHLVFADAEDADARGWLAASYEQMGFQAESGAWRNYYLSAAMELRDGLPDQPPLSTGNRAFYQAVPTLDLFDALAVRFDPDRFEHAPVVIQFEFPDRNEVISLDVTTAVAFPRQGEHGQAATRVTLDRSVMDQLLLGEVTVPELLSTQQLVINGRTEIFFAYLGALDQFDPLFNVVKP